MRRPRSARERFAGAIALAAVSAVTLPGTLLVAGPVLGRGGAFTIHWLLTAVAHVVWLAPGPRRARWAAVFVLGVGGTGAALCASTSRAVGLSAALGLPVVIALTVALARSLILHRIDRVRGLVFEGAIGISALAVTWLLAGPSLLAACAALWGFWLVESLSPLVAGWRRYAGAREDRDPFVRAVSQLDDLLGEV